MYTENFETIIKKVLKHEGGYVNDPSDRGGETNFGISKKAFPEEDIKNLTEERATYIYHEKYWKPSKTYLLPEELQEIYFDMVVNFGPRGAGRVLQHAINGKYKSKGGGVVVDGRVGPKTLKAIKKLEADRLRAYRVLKFAEIVCKDPSQEKFWFGWFRRALHV
jgi:lysozyme family protein